MHGVAILEYANQHDVIGLSGLVVEVLVRSSVWMSHWSVGSKPGLDESLECWFEAQYG